MLETLSLSWHIVRRHWTVYSKDFIANISPTLADPAFTLLALGAGLGPLVASFDGHTYLQFLAPGLVAAMALFTSFFEASYGFYVTMTFEHIFKAMLTTPIGSREVLLGELMWLFIKGAVMAGGISIVLALFGMMHDPGLLPLMPLIGGLIALPCGALGLIASGLVRNINQFQSVYSFVIAPLYFFSGVFFPVSHAPAWYQWAVNVSPLYHGVRLCQMAFWYEGETKMILFHLAMLLVFTVVLTLVANRLVRKMLVA